MSIAVPRISVITIVKNDRTGLLRTIESVRRQRFRDFEHIVVDGASTDGSVGVIHAHAADLTRWVSEADGGIADAFNKGLSMARGEWINFLNAGDAFADADSLMLVAPHLDGPGVVCGYSVMDGVRSPPYRISDDDAVPRRAWIGHQAAFTHRRVFQTCGGFDVRFRVRMDYEFWLRALPRFRLEMVDAVLAEVARGGISATHTRLFLEEECAANRLHLRHAWWINLRVRGRARMHRWLRRLGVFEHYRRMRLPRR